MGQRLLDVRDVASLGQQESAVGLVQAADLLRQAVPGKAPVQLGAVHHLVRQAVELARLSAPSKMAPPSGPASTLPVMWRSRSPARLSSSRHSS